MHSWPAKQIAWAGTKCWLNPVQFKRAAPMYGSDGLPSLPVFIALINSIMPPFALTPPGKNANISSSDRFPVKPPGKKTKEYSFQKMGAYKLQIHTVWVCAVGFLLSQVRWLRGLGQLLRQLLGFLAQGHAVLGLAHHRRLVLLTVAVNVILARTSPWPASIRTPRNSESRKSSELVT